MSCLFEVLSIKLLRTYLGRDLLFDLFYLLLPQIYVGLEGHSTHFILKEEFGDTKGVIKIPISKKNRPHSGQKKKVQKEKQRSTN